MHAKISQKQKIDRFSRALASKVEYYVRFARESFLNLKLKVFEITFLWARIKEKFRVLKYRLGPVFVTGVKSGHHKRVCV